MHCVIMDSLEANIDLKAILVAKSLSLFPFKVFSSERSRRSKRKLCAEGRDSSYKADIFWYVN